MRRRVKKKQRLNAHKPAILSYAGNRPRNNANKIKCKNKNHKEREEKRISTNLLAAKKREKWSEQEKNEKRNHHQRRHFYIHMHTRLVWERIVSNFDACNKIQEMASKKNNQRNGRREKNKQQQQQQQPHTIVQTLVRKPHNTDLCNVIECANGSLVDGGFVNLPSSRSLARSLVPGQQRPNRPQLWHM